MSLLSSLNPQQREAVEYTDGASLVIAGAGSGKTRVLTYKIAHLIQQGMEPWRIMALTFTNKAADEMKERIAVLVGAAKARQLQMGTFHSIFARILRHEAESIGYNSHYTIYDEADSRQLIKQIVKELSLDDKIYKPATLQGRLSMAKNHLILPEQYRNSDTLRKRDKDSKMSKTTEIYDIYQQRLKQNNAMDFDDLLVNTYLFFNQNEEKRQAYEQHWQYILVDEYQDTNLVQQAILLQLTREQQHICVVGDDAQSIYAFRGANIDNILDFQQHYNQTKLFKLERNYRSTQMIVNAAGSLIRNNQRQIEKNVYSKEKKGNPITVKACSDDKAEAAYVCRQITRCRKKDNIPLNDIAILYRTHAQSRVFEDELRKQQTPYRIIGGMSFYQRKEIKDIMAYLRLIVNNKDEEALRRIINYPTRGIGATTVAKMTDMARQTNCTLWKILEDDTLEQLQVNNGTRSKLRNFRDSIYSYGEKAQQLDAYTFGEYIIKHTGIADELLADTSVEGLSRQENMQEFLTSLHDFVAITTEEDPQSFPSINDFLLQAALKTDIEQQADDNADAVTLMTVHAAKGLEYHTVFIVGMEENIFPSQQALFSVRDLEEERRLLYVAITRAKTNCHLTYAENRFRYGTIEFNSPSRFIKELDKTCLKGDDVSTTRGFSQSGIKQTKTRDMSSLFNTSQPRRRSFVNINRFSSSSDSPQERIHHVNNKRYSTYPSSTDFPSGTRVLHQRFGEGTVLESEGKGDDLKVKVRFDSVGEKILLAKFAKLVII